MSAKKYEEFCPEMSELPDLFEQKNKYLHRLCSHILIQSADVSEEDERSCRWDMLISSVGHGLQSLEDADTTKPGSLADIALTFYWLGKSTQELEGEATTEKIALLKEYMKLKEADIERSKPRLKREAGYETLREIVLSDAALIWAKDSKQEMRIGFMAETLRSDLQGRIDFEEWPCPCPTVATVKKWLAEIAPEYARAKGRPKK